MKNKEKRKGIDLTLIIGKRSNLSKKLFDNLNNCILVSSHDVEHNIYSLFEEYKNDVINIIFNNFQSSVLLNDNSDLSDYIIKSILNTSKVLTFLIANNIKINKIIYTSSSSVYGNNKFCSESDQVQPMNLQGALKIANEELIKRFCAENNISYIITRIFNMYGGNDNFSIISKMKNAYLHNEELSIINDGIGIRDYIHIDDVVDTYKILLDDENNNSQILNIASGDSKKLIDIFNILIKNDILINTVNIQRKEIAISVANIELLNKLINTKKFIKVEDYLLEELINEK